MPGFDPSTYEPVQSRIEKFWSDYPTGRIVTSLVAHEGDLWVVSAALYRADEPDPFSTGYAHEIAGQGNVNRTSALENCETSAIGRALANAGYAGSNRASSEEMRKTQPTSQTSSAPNCNGCGESLAGSKVVPKDGKRYHEKCVDTEPF